MSLLASIQRWRWRYVRLKYKVLTFHDYGARLNRSVEVQNRLLECAAGKGAALSRQECAVLAAKLGVPKEFRREFHELTRTTNNPKDT